jgi:cytochrome c oxidase subunit 2
MFENLIVQASSYAAGIDNLILLITVLVGFWFVLVQAIFFGFIFKFRAKPGRKAEYITGTEKRQKRWIAIPHFMVLVCDVFIVIASFRVWYDVKMDLPPADAELRIIGQQWAWTFQHPGADGELDTADDIFSVDELHVQNDLTYHFHLESKDVLHDFSVPVWRIKQGAVPGRSIMGWFQPTLEGTFDVQCAEICGFGHGVMVAKVMVTDATEHAAWVAANTPVAAGTPVPANRPEGN